MKSSLAHHGDQRSSWQCSAEDQRFNWRSLPSFTQCPSQEFTARQTASFESFKHNDDDRSWKERWGSNGCLIFPCYLLFSFFVSRIYGLWLRFPPFLFIFDRQKDNGTCTIMSGIEGVLWYFNTSLIRLQRTRTVKDRKRSQMDTDLFPGGLMHYVLIHSNFEHENICPSTAKTALWLRSSDTSSPVSGYRTNRQWSLFDLIWRRRSSTNRS